MKNTRMMTADTDLNRRDRSRNRRSKNAGMAITSSVLSEYTRSRGATIFQFSHVPMVRPIAIQDSINPVAYSAPGNPIINQPDMSEAPADNAATRGDRSRPASKKSQPVFVRRYA